METNTTAKEIRDGKGHSLYMNISSDIIEL